MLSRVAHSTYELNRLIEYIDNVANFILASVVNTTIVTDQQFAITLWQSLSSVAGDCTASVDDQRLSQVADVINHLIKDKQNPQSFLQCAQKIKLHALNIRDSIDTHYWESVSALCRCIEEDSPDNIKAVQMISDSIRLITGHTQNAGFRGEHWHFAELGKAIQRGEAVARYLKTLGKAILALSPTLPYHNYLLSTLLQATSAEDIYRKRYHFIEIKKVFNFLFFEKQFPKSLAFVVQQMQCAMNEIQYFTNRQCISMNKIMSLDNQLYSTSQSLFQQGITAFLDQYINQLTQIDKSLYQSFFNFTPFSYKVDSALITKNQHTQ